LDAVNLCNTCGIAHRDIKLQNITFPIENRQKHLGGDTGESDNPHSPQDSGDRYGDEYAYEEEEEEDLSIKLADFGMAGFVGKDGLLRGR
jgi:serine/threonine protein kinase